MFGFNWIDFIILAILAGAIYAGVRVGLSIQLFVVIGFFGALFFGGWLFPRILPINDRTLLTIVNGNLVLIFAIFVAVKGFDLGRHFRYLLGEGKLFIIESRMGVLVSVLAVLIIVWLLGAMVSRLPFAGFSNSVNDARIVRYLNDHLPPVPAVFALFDKQVNPNAQPYVFENKKPPLAAAYNTQDFKKAEAVARDSTVRITSFGCGGLVSGTGFVVGKDRVVTNAHVIAGVKRPVVKYKNHSYSTTPILFDANLDLAILQAKDLPAKPLDIATGETPIDTNVAVLGFPDGNYSLVGGVIRNDLQLFGRNIYDVAVIGRQVYEVQAKINNGSSGGPIILSDGRVAGMIFAKSKEVDDYGYALTSPSIRPDINQSYKNSQSVSTGFCLAS